MLTYAFFSEKGSREINEDFVKIKIKNRKKLMIVADGLGGHSKGEVASSLVASTVAETFDYMTANTQESLANGMRVAQERLLAEQIKENDLNGMKTTAVVLLVTEKEIHMVHVGDSRGYVFYKKGKLKKTVDHSIPQLLALSGEIKEKEIRNHPDRSRLLRVFGMPWEREEYEFQSVIALEEARAILLCSDGFWELIDERRMKACLFGAKTAQEWLDRMKKIVEKNGKEKEMDNYSAVAVLIR